MNQCNTNKQNLEEKIGNADKKIPDMWLSDYNCSEYKN